MNLPFWMDDLAAYSFQIAVLVAAGSLLQYVFRLRVPSILLRYWQAQVIACLLLPALQPWRRAVVYAVPFVASPLAPITVPPSQPIGPLRAPFPTYETIALALAAGIGLRLVWLAVGLVRLSFYRRRARLLANPPDAVEEMRMRVSIRPDIYISPELHGPVTFGLGRGAILLPASFLGIDERFQRAIVCHELLHVRRRDWIHVILEDALRSLFWFHPAVWWAVSRIQLYREQTVDQEVLNLTGERKPYLESLLHIASMRNRPAALPAPLFLKERHLAQRITLMLREVAMSKTREFVGLSAAVVLLLCTGRLATAWFPLTGPAIVREVPQHAGGTSAQPLREPIRVGEGVLRSKLLHTVEPVYPELARRARISGAVILQITVNEAGEVNEAKVLRGHPLLQDAALTAVKQWRYSPTLLNGIPVPVTTTVTLSFGPGGSAPAAQFSASAGEAPQQVTNPVAKPLREPIRVGGNIQEWKLLRKVEPAYPEAARAARVSGVVILQVTVNEAGEVYEAGILRGHPLLDEAALTAVRQWRYSATLLNGEPVPVIATVPVIFNLRANDLLVRVDETGALRDLYSQLEGTALVQKMREAKNGVILQPSPQLPLRVIEDTVRSLQKDGVKNLSVSGFEERDGRLFAVAPSISDMHIVTSAGGRGGVPGGNTVPGVAPEASAASAMATSSGIVPPLLALDREQLVSIAKSSGVESLPPEQKTLAYKLYMNEVGEILGIRQLQGPKIPALENELLRTRVVGPGRRGADPVPVVFIVVVAVP